jgi:hypothetical protein
MKIIRVVAIAQITVDGVVIASGLAAILGLVFASFPKGPSLTFIIGGITGIIAARTIKFITCFAENSKFRDLQENIRKQLSDILEGIGKMNGLIKYFCKELLIFSGQIKHYRHKTGEDFYDDMP